jgi:hypothetical protein
MSKVAVGTLAYDKKVLLVNRAPLVFYLDFNAFFRLPPLFWFKRATILVAATVSGLPAGPGPVIVMIRLMVCGLVLAECAGCQKHDKARKKEDADNKPP